MRLNKKLLIILVAIILIPLIIGVVAIYYGIRYNVNSIEEDKAKTNLQSVETFLDSLKENHGASYLSWTEWDDCYDAIANKNKDWINENIFSTAKKGTPNEAFVILDKNGKIIDCLDAPQDLKTIDYNNFGLYKKLTSGNSPYKSGIVNTLDGMYLATLTRVYKAEDKEHTNVSGYILYMQKVTNALIGTGKTVIGVDINIAQRSGGILTTSNELSKNSNNINDFGNNTTLISSKVVGKEMNITASKIYNDSDGNPVGILSVKTTSTSGVKALNSLLIYSTVLIILILISFILILLWFRYNIINPITQASQFAKTVAVGDLRTRIKCKHNDEIGELLRDLNNTANNLENMTRKVKNTSEVVAKSAQFISTNNEDLSQKAQLQATSIQETSSAMEELNSTVKKNAENANLVNKMTTTSVEDVKEGNIVINETINAMQEINDSSNRILEIINVVNDIAFQTNLLALNAATESARAGEQGKGFAVVATEVRNLAQRSGEAAKEIQRLISDSVEKVKKGNQLVLKTSGTLNKITKSIEDISELISEISVASKEQALGVEEVNKAIVLIDTAIQQNTTLVEASNATSQQMNSEAEQLYDLTLKFKVNS